MFNLKLNESLFIEMSEQEILEEARKKKSKKRGKGKLSFKGFGWWPIYINDEDHNCGNMEYNNAMFNKMMGSADLGDTSISNDGGGDAGVGVGMGESLDIKEDTKISLNVKKFILKYSQLINDEEWDDLFEIAEEALHIEE